MARLTVAQKKELAAAAAALPKFKEDDIVIIKITGTIIEASENSYGVSYDDGEEFWWAGDEKGIEVEVVESAAIYDENDVIMDAEGCIFVRVPDWRGDLSWKGVGDHCERPTRPYKIATFN